MIKKHFFSDFPLTSNKIKNKTKHHRVITFPKSIRNIVERDKIYSTHIQLPGLVLARQ